MPLLLATSLLLIAFLAGSIPNGFLIARAKGIDIRKHGSGNIGATNVWRVCGRNAGLLCFFLDFLKGLIPVLIAGAFIHDQVRTPLPGALSPDGNGAVALWLGAAISAVFGHMYTPWLGFKGGKGISTGFGALIGVYPVFTLACIIALIVWLIALKLTKMVGISSVIAAAAVAIVVVGSHLAPDSIQHSLASIPIYKRATAVHAAFAAGLLLLITYKHRGNIARTLKGTEPKINQRKTTGIVINEPRTK